MPHDHLNILTILLDWINFSGMEVKRNLQLGKELRPFFNSSHWERKTSFLGRRAVQEPGGIWGGTGGQWVSGIRPKP
jgi:hypothetical protein